MIVMDRRRESKLRRWAYGNALTLTFLAGYGIILYFIYLLRSAGVL